MTTTTLLAKAVAAMKKEEAHSMPPSGVESVVDGWAIGDSVRVLESGFFSGQFYDDESEAYVPGVIASVRTGGYNPVLIWLYSPVNDECFPFEPYELEEAE